MNKRQWIPILAVIAVGMVAYRYLEPEHEVAQPQVERAAASPDEVIEPEIETSPTSVAQPTPVSQSTQAVVELAKEEGLDDYSDWQRELVEGLIVLNDADSLIAAALILHALYAEDLAESQRVVRLIRQASSHAPSDRVIAATALRLCRSIKNCADARYEAAVRNMDSRNSLGPLAEVLDKMAKGTPEEGMDALQLLGTLELRLYHADLLTRVVRVIASAPTSPRFAPPTGDLVRLHSELALRAVNALEVPEFLALGKRCQDMDYRTRRECMSVVNDLKSAELIELQLTALGIERLYGGGTSARRSSVGDAEGYLAWIRRTVAQTSPPAEQWVALYSQHPTELGVSRAWLEQNGIQQRAVPAGISVGR